MFVLPMLGLSSRFFAAGYDRPKYRLPLGEGFTVFDHVLKSFEDYFATDHFRIICRKDFDDFEFIKMRLEALGITNHKVIQYDRDTLGQAHSVSLAIDEIDNDDELFVFNIDTILRDFVKADFKEDCDGYLEVFEGDGEHWSFVEPAADSLDSVRRVTEKVRISNLCSNGLYYFDSCRLFQSLVESEISNLDRDMELYVAPLYNKIISGGGVVKYKLVSSGSIRFCGTPDEYEALVTA